MIVFLLQKLTAQRQLLESKQMLRNIPDFQLRDFVRFNNTQLADDINFIYSEKATKFCEIFPLHLTVCTGVKSKGKILQNSVAFSKYMNFNA